MSLGIFCQRVSAAKRAWRQPTARPGPWESWDETQVRLRRQTFRVKTCFIFTLTYNANIVKKTH